MYHPVRGGTRGGADQFNWDDVKEDKYRENYLGHSLKAPVGRWQKGKDLTWYAKEPAAAKASGTVSSSGDDRAAQLKALKKAEEEAMLNALGFSTVKTSHQQLSKEEINEALRRGESKRDELDVERVAGVGTGSRGQFLASSGGKVSKEGVSFVSVGSSREREDGKEKNSSGKRKTEDGHSSKSKKHKKHKKRHRRSRSRS